MQSFIVKFRFRNDIFRQLCTHVHQIVIVHVQDQCTDSKFKSVMYPYRNNVVGNYEAYSYQRKGKEIKDLGLLIMELMTFISVSGKFLFLFLFSSVILHV